MRIAILASLALLACAGAARAEVIEISDDGEARTLGVPASADARGEDVAGEAAAGDPFVRAARRHGLDLALLRAVAWTESRGRNDAVSPKGARGVMQLMPATAAELGVDPRDPASNIDGGAAYLARQLAAFRDVPLALAAYNAGPGAVVRYRGVPPYAETRDYVDRIMRRWRPAAQPASTASGPKVGEPAAPAIPDPRVPILLIEVSEQ